MCTRLCSFEKCSSNPAVVCNCEAIPVLICQEHIKNHSQLQRSHTYTKVFSEIREEARKSAIKLFSKIKPELIKLKSNIIQEELSMIKEINKISKNALEKLKTCEENLNQIILEISSLRFIDNSKSSTFVESLLKMQQQDIEKIKKIRGPKLSINSIDSNFKVIINRLLVKGYLKREIKRPRKPINNNLIFLIFFLKFSNLRPHQNVSIIGKIVVIIPE